MFFAPSYLEHGYGLWGSYVSLQRHCKRLLEVRSLGPRVSLVLPVAVLGSPSSTDGGHSAATFIVKFELAVLEFGQEGRWQLHSRCQPRPTAEGRVLQKGQGACWCGL